MLAAGIILLLIGLLLPPLAPGLNADGQRLCHIVAVLGVICIAIAVVLYAT